MNTGQRPHARTLLGLSCPSVNYLYCLGSELWVGRWINSDVSQQRVFCLQCGSGGTNGVTCRECIGRTPFLWAMHEPSWQSLFPQICPRSNGFNTCSSCDKNTVSYTNKYVQYIWKCLKDSCFLVFFKNNLYLFVIYVYMQDDVLHRPEWPWILCVAEDHFKFRSSSFCFLYAGIPGMEIQCWGLNPGLCMLGKHSTNWPMCFLFTLLVSV